MPQRDTNFGIGTLASKSLQDSPQWTRRSASKAWTGSARSSDAPFHHLEFDKVFPDDVYAAMLTAMPVASDYRPMSGRAKGNDLADGTHTRVKIDLFPEYIRSLPP